MIFQVSKVKCLISLFYNVIDVLLFIKETNQLGFKDSVFPTNKETIYLLAVNEIINHSLANMKNISYIAYF